MILIDFMIIFKWVFSFWRKQFDKIKNIEYDIDTYDQNFM